MSERQGSWIERIPRALFPSRASDLKSLISERKANSNFIFFDDRKTKCKIVRTRYAAVCDAVEFSRLVS